MAPESSCLKATTGANTDDGTLLQLFNGIRRGAKKKKVAVAARDDGFDIYFTSYTKPRRLVCQNLRCAADHVTLHTNLPCKQKGTMFVYEPLASSLMGEITYGP